MSRKPNKRDYNTEDSPDRPESNAESHICKKRTVLNGYWLVTESVADINNIIEKQPGLGEVLANGNE